MPTQFARRLTSRHRTFRANRQLGWGMAFVAGAINAGGFLAIGQYTSHVTGIVSSLGDNLVLGQYPLVVTALGALLCFLLGAMTTTLLVHFARRRRLSSEFALPLVLEALLILVFGLAGANMLDARSILVPTTVGLLAFLMGLQNAVVTKLSGNVIRTTHMTGIVTDLGIELGKWLYRNRGHTDSPDVMADRERLVVLVGLLFAFAIGGVVGASGFKHVGFMFSLPIAAILAVIAAVPLFDDLRTYRLLRARDRRRR